MPLFMEKRFPILLTLIIYIFFIYTTQAVILIAQAEDAIEPEYGKGSYQEGWDAELNETKVEEDLDVTSEDVFGIFGFIFNFATFSYLEMPLPIFFVLNFVNLIVLITIIFISASLIYDFIKALPFT